VRFWLEASVAQPSRSKPRLRPVQPPVRLDVRRVGAQTRVRVDVTLIRGCGSGLCGGGVGVFSRPSSTGKVPQRALREGLFNETATVRTDTQNCRSSALRFHTLSTAASGVRRQSSLLLKSFSDIPWCFKFQESERREKASAMRAVE
jgi:hypothetical protein